MVASTCPSTSALATQVLHSLFLLFPLLLRSLAIEALQRRSEDARGLPATRQLRVLLLQVTDSVVNTPNPNPVTVSVTSPSATTVTTTDSVDYTVFNCDICDYTTSTKRGVLTHKGHKHKEELRKEDENESLEISIVIEKKRGEDNNYLPLANSTFDGETELVGNDPLRLELQENGLAKIVIFPDSPPPTLVLHP